MAAWEPQPALISVPSELWHSIGFKWVYGGFHIVSDNIRIFPLARKWFDFVGEKRAIRTRWKWTASVQTRPMCCKRKNPLIILFQPIPQE